ncbi:O-antigen ligase family protein [Flavobacterium sp. 2]|uniref:O-antigen ligase family protein n=1 Tax=Flavobacterium sp. 2 TaxID=308053 RepID=UPI003CF59BC7
MYKYQILFLIIAFQSVRALLSKNKTGSKYLLLSFFIITIPLEFTWSVLQGNLKTFAGTLGTNLNITIPLLIVLFFFLFSKFKIKQKVKYSIWIKGIFAIYVISLLNPYNTAKFATFVSALFLVSHLIFFIYIFKNLTHREIILALYDGFMIICILQFFLAICFPLLGISQVTTIFHDSAGESATRMGTREGAVGLFVHPGNVALYTTVVSTFFLGCYLRNYKKKKSLIILVLNVITLILTYSRTAYLVFVIDMAIVYYICTNAEKAIFTIRNVIKFILPLSLALIYLVFFSPLSATFLESDANEMLDARMMHWFMGFQIFNTSPLIGVGINGHLEYMFTNFNLFGGKIIDDFFWENPIHNIHLIVLVETGLIGFVFWIFFIFSNISKAKKDIARKRNLILSATQIGTLIGVLLYGITGWAPFSNSILPFLLMVSFFTIQYRNAINSSN